MARTLVFIQGIEYGSLLLLRQRNRRRSTLSCPRPRCVCTASEEVCVELRVLDGVVVVDVDLREQEEVPEPAPKADALRVVGV